jgi:hypothetical protein
MSPPWEGGIAQGKTTEESARRTRPGLAKPVEQARGGQVEEQNSPKLRRQYKSCLPWIQQQFWRPEIAS